MISFTMPFVCAACRRIINDLKPPKIKKPQPLKEKPLPSIDHLKIPKEVISIYKKYGKLNAQMLCCKLELDWDYAKRIELAVEMVIRGYG